MLGRVERISAQQQQQATGTATSETGTLTDWVERGGTASVCFWAFLGGGIQFTGQQEQHDAQLRPPRTMTLIHSTLHFRHCRQMRSPTE